MSPPDFEFGLSQAEHPALEPNPKQQELMPNNFEPLRMLKFDELPNIYAPQTGDVITGLDGKQIDGVEHRIGQHLSQLGSAVYKTPLSKALRPKGLGELRDGAIAILGKTDPRPHKDLYPKPGIWYWVAADVHSTGKGKIGSISLEAFSHYQRFANRPSFETRAMSRRIIQKYTGEDLDSLLMSLREQSVATAHQVAIDGLKHAFYGGLPGLKR